MDFGALTPLAKRFDVEFYPLRGASQYSKLDLLTNAGTISDVATLVLLSRTVGEVVHGAFEA